MPTSSGPRALQSGAAGLAAAARPGAAAACAAPGRRLGGRGQRQAGVVLAQQGHHIASRLRIA